MNASAETAFMVLFHGHSSSLKALVSAAAPNDHTSRSHVVCEYAIEGGIFPDHQKLLEGRVVQVFELLITQSSFWYSRFLHHSHSQLV